MENNHPKPEQDRDQQESTADGSTRPPDSHTVEEFNFAEYKKGVLADPKARKVIEGFLKYHHREWEENIASEPPLPIKRE